MKQFGQEMAELWPKTARARTFMCQKVGDFTCYQDYGGDLTTKGLYKGTSVDSGV